MLIPGAESFHQEFNIFLNPLKKRCSDAKDLEISGGGERPFEGGRETLLKGSNMTDDLS